MCVTGIISVIAVVLAVIGILMQIPPDKLGLDLIDGTYGDVDRIKSNNQDLGQDCPSRFFHVAVKNKCKRKTARNCYAFLKSLRNAETGEEYVKQSFELKWRAYQSPSATILPETYRKFDSFLVRKGQPDILLMDAFLDSSRLMLCIQGRADLIAEYWVVSDNFKIAKGVFAIHLDKDLDKVSMSKKH